MLQNPMRYVIPVCRQVEAKAWAPAGSAVLLTASDRSCWVASAAHVLAECDHVTLGLAAGRGLYFYLESGGLIVLTCEGSPEAAAADTRDLAFAPLIRGIPSLLRDAGWDFWPIDQTGSPEGTADACVLSGYLNRTQQSANVDPTFCEPAALLSPAKVGLRRGLDRRYHLVARWPRKSSAGGRPALNPDGLSGGAIWQEQAGESRLLGIITEYDRRRREIFGTSIGPMVKEIIRRIGSEAGANSRAACSHT